MVTETSDACRDQGASSLFSASKFSLYLLQQSGIFNDSARFVQSFNILQFYWFDFDKNDSQS